MKILITGMEAIPSYVEKRLPQTEAQTLLNINEGMIV